MTEPLIFVGTVFLVLDCALLTFLILMQLPKKDAGMGTAFGTGATDALFGAGAGNVLTKLTKWCAIFFLSMALLLSLLHKSRASRLTDSGGDPTKAPQGSGSTGTPTGQRPALLPTNGTAPLPGTNATATPASNATVPPAPKGGNATDANKTRPPQKSSNASAPANSNGTVPPGK